MDDDQQPDDPLPALLAALDQALSMAPQLARMARGYFDAFEHEGFTASQALYLTAAQIHSTPGSAP